MRILLIEDEKKVASFIKRGLREQHYAVDLVFDGEEGLFMAENNPYDLIILDRMLPKKDGLTICRELRRKKIITPILMLTALGETEDKVHGLDSGADDYLTKPFAFDELLARIRVLLRRPQAKKTTLLKIADLELDQLTHKVRRNGEEIVLTSTEYALLEYLMLHVNEVVTRTMISEHVWHDDFDTYSNIINVYINYLRNKIDKDARIKLLHSIRGTGYILKEEP
jgi:DNA-binding response OmpR family regulator